MRGEVGVQQIQQQHAFRGNELRYNGYKKPALMPSKNGCCKAAQARTVVQDCLHCGHMRYEMSSAARVYSGHTRTVVSRQSTNDINNERQHVSCSKLWLKLKLCLLLQVCVYGTLTRPETDCGQLVGQGAAAHSSRQQQKWHQGQIMCKGVHKALMEGEQQEQPEKKAP